MGKLLALGLALLLAGCGQMETEEEADDYEALIAAAPVSQVEGEAVSPDGRFEVRAEGAGGSYISGVQPPELLQIVDRETGEVLWQDQGWLSQSVLWSPEGGFLALARSARTYCFITVFETESWTGWEFALPDGSPIPEYTFLPYNEPWGVWQSENSLELTIGRGGEWGGQQYYTCGVAVHDGELEGTVCEESREALPGSYDFDHDGEPETVELATVYGNEEAGRPSWYELRIRTGDNRLYWSRSCGTVHVGWATYFACRMDGQDYLLRYLPTMYQGYASYTYELFSLIKPGEEQVVREGSVNFNMNFGEMHKDFKPEEIAAFLEEVHGLLEDSELLLTTEGGDFRSGGPGTEFKDDFAYWTDDPLYDGGKSLEENIRAIGDYWREQRAG